MLTAAMSLHVLSAALGVQVLSSICSYFLEHRRAKGAVTIKFGKSIGDTVERLGAVLEE
jgi:threonine/homoserine efflux transporter RhtA